MASEEEGYGRFEKGRAREEESSEVKAYETLADVAVRLFDGQLSRKEIMSMPYPILLKEMDAENERLDKMSKEEKKYRANKKAMKDFGI